MKDKSLSHIFKLTSYLFLRILLICALSMMASTLTIKAPIMNPIFGIFYFFALIYFFALTCHHEGMSDRNRVETSLIKKKKAKGFISAAIIIVPMLLAGAIPVIFMDGIKNIFTNVLSIIYAIFSLSVMNLADTFVGDTGSKTIAFAVYATVYAVCLICAGISYILGFEDKHPFRKITDKFASWKNS